jgi:catechol 2,3-dioxygenase-like lactoylglutathione lyase family enzyme
MRIKGLIYVGTHTSSRPAMSQFVGDVLGLAPQTLTGTTADFFSLPDGASFAVADSEPGEPDERTVGFVVEDVAAAWAELRDAGVETDEEISENTRYRYVHFRAPDGRLYELVEERPA